MDKKVQKGEYLDIILRSKKTIFSAKDIALLWGDPNIKAVKVRISYYVKNGKLIRLRKGLYAKDREYDKYELAVNILRPSYISFETVLTASGINFQYYEQIFAASYVKRELTCDGNRYSYQTIKNSVLINPKGIDQSEEYSIATKERAFLDVIYRSKDYHFDNLSPLDWDEIFEILPIYKSKRMERKVQEYYDYYKSNK